MPCIANECRSGRIKPCPAPEVCYPDLHRVTMAAEHERQADNARRAGVHEPTNDTDVHDPARGILAAIAITGVCVLVALISADAYGWFK